MLRHTHSHTGKSHKNRKPENIVYTQKTYKVKEKISEKELWDTKVLKTIEFVLCWTSFFNLDNGFLYFNFVCFIIKNHWK